MSVWLAIPSKRPPEEAEPVLKVWRQMGYKIALHCDGDDGEAIRAKANMADHITVTEKYPGYAIAINTLCKKAIERSTAHPEWFVCAGDDTLPDPNHTAEEIAWECVAEFRHVHAKLGTRPRSPDFDSWGTFGVMQPTGDPWSDSAGRIIERIAGSPWIGREFARRMYGGAGPYWHEYTHCFVDEELQNVAQNLGVFWQRPDLIHHHQNWARPKHPSFPAGNACDMPDFLREANSPEHWAKYKGIFKARKAAGFPGHEPIA